MAEAEGRSLRYWAIRVAQLSGLIAIAAGLCSTGLLLILAAVFRLLDTWYNTNTALLVTGILAIAFAGGFTWCVIRLTR